MPQKNVTVTPDFNGMTVQNGQWVGSPTWTFDPDTLHVQNGQNNITWTLSPANPPAGYTAAFPASNPIVFKPDPAWTGGTPTKQADGTVQASDNFQNITAAVHYHYTTTVALTPNANNPTGVAGAWSHDPEVENDPGGGILKSV